MRPRSVLLRAALVLLVASATLALALGKTALGGVERSQASSAPRGPSHPASAIGVSLPNAPDHAAALSSYIHSAGRRPTIVMWYQAWSEPLFYPGQLAHVRRIGAVPMITWEPALDGKGISLAAIARGRYDSIINRAARAAAAAGQRMYIRFGHEMNLASSMWGPGQPGDSARSFVAAWRHIVTLFRRAGADNVEWVWSPNVDCNGRCPFTQFYPGNAWVDWVALDGYNYAATDDSPWMSFNQVFRRSYEILARLSSKPVMIAETGTVGTPHAKAAWIDHAFEKQLPAYYPRVHAIVWFDHDVGPNWTITSSRQSLLAWRRIVASKLYRASPATLSAVAPWSSSVTTDRTPQAGTLHATRATALR